MTAAQDKALDAAESLESWVGNVDEFGFQTREGELMATLIGALQVGSKQESMHAFRRVRAALRGRDDRTDKLLDELQKQIKRMG